MTKKIVCLLAIASFGLGISCKKTEADTSLQSQPSTDVDIPKMSRPVLQTPTPPIDGRYPVMAFAKTEHDFGMIKSGDKVTYTFDFKNTGEADLLISDAKGSCGCTVPEFPKDPIKPGDSGKIKVIFNSSGKYGQQMKSVNITANTSTGKETIKIKASIPPKAGA